MIVSAHSLLLDSEALSAAAQDQRVMQPWLELARQSDLVLYVSAATLAEVTDGSARDALVRRIVKAMRVVPVTAEIGYSSGGLRHVAATTRRKARDLTVDAIVAATAVMLPPPTIVLTSDPDDLRLLLQDTQVRVEGLNP